MYTPADNSYEWQTDSQFDESSNFSTTTTSIAPTGLASYLRTPPGWRSEIVHSNSSLPIDARTHSTSYYQSHRPTNIFNENIEYINDNNEIIQAEQTILNEQQENNIIRAVERQNPPPLVVRKSLPNNSVVYRQNVSVRYLQPPPLPPPGPLIIREVRPPQPPAPPPLRIRQRPKTPPKPPPIVLRERPPSFPRPTPTQIVEKILPTPPQPARRVIVERYNPPPPKPPDVIIERWLPYKPAGPRRVLVERAPPIHQSPDEPNLIIRYDSPKAIIRRHYIDEGVACADPDAYLRQYGTEFYSRPVTTKQIDLIHEASRAVPPSTIADYGYHRVSSPYPWDVCDEPPLSHSSSYCNYTSSPSYYELPPSDCEYVTPRFYVQYPKCRRAYRTLVDVTPSWNTYCNSSSPCDYYYPSYSYPAETIRARSEGEFQNIMAHLTHGRMPIGLGSY